MDSNAGRDEKSAVPVAAPPAQALHTKSGPVMDVLPPRTPADNVATAPDEPNESSHEQSTEAPKPAAKPIKPPKPAGSGVGAAITATAIIVLALSAMAVYAYLQTQ